ncbi:MAG: DUF2961 domain-containing protein [Spirochaetaceae bacterium]|nr:DUF2961 domain-containing protein [Spirochaetaceae bacterium]
MKDIASITPLYKAPSDNIHSRWVSPENPTGEKEKGGLTNRGGKGNAFYVIPSGETKTIFDVKGAGIITRMWSSGTIVKKREQRRAVRIDMYWDGGATPAVSAPIGDFFGIAHGLRARFESELFSSPEGRSFLFTIPMPFRKSALITVTNESSEEVWLWYDINYLSVESIPDDAMYFHTYWNRDPKTMLGEDYTILPNIRGRGRYLGTNIGVIGGIFYNGTWFGEGEVKIYLDGDTTTPTLVGTGTEDYIGTGWGQQQFVNRYQGSLVADDKADVYAFYRYHIVDPVYFHSDCSVTIQQIGNTPAPRIKEMEDKGAELIPIWYNGTDKKPTYQGRLLDEHSHCKYTDEDFPRESTHFYRRDDVCATAYFYLDCSENGLPSLPYLDLRLKYLKERVWDRLHVEKSC